MNKQVIIAGVLGAAAAQKCEGEIYKQAEEARDALAQKLQGAVEAAEAAAALALGDAYNARSDARNAYDNAVEAMEAYETSYTTVNGLKSAADDAFDTASELADSYAGADGIVAVALQASTDADDYIAASQEGQDLADQVGVMVTLKDQMDAAAAALVVASADKSAETGVFNDREEAWEDAVAINAAALENNTAAWAGDVAAAWIDAQQVPNTTARSACVPTWVQADLEVYSYADLTWTTDGAAACDPDSDPRKSLNTWLADAKTALGVEAAAESGGGVAGGGTDAVLASGAYDTATTTAEAYAGTKTKAKDAAKAKEAALWLTRMLQAGCHQSDDEGGGAIAACGAAAVLGDNAADAVAYAPSAGTDRYDLGIQWTAAATNNVSLATDATNESALHVTAREAAAKANMLTEYWPALITTIETEVTRSNASVLAAVGTTLGLKDTAATAKAQAEANYARAEAEQVAANAQYARGEVILAALQAKSDVNSDAAVVKRYLHAEAVKEQAAADADLAIKDAAKTALGLRATFALATITDAKPNTAFLLALKQSADAALLDLQMDENEADDREVAAREASEMAGRTFQAVVAACKSQGYDRALENLAKQTEKTEADAATAAGIVTTYAEKSAMPESGLAGASCAFPAKEGDAAQEPRPACPEEHCCGAAQKFLKDGTKLTVETCQPLDTHVYQYWPELMEGALAEPAPESWRFQCISGAQKLVAAATAALAASYMMA